MRSLENEFYWQRLTFNPQPRKASYLAFRGTPNARRLEFVLKMSQHLRGGVMGVRWQRLILEALEKYGAFYLTDLLAEPYSLSDYNALTRACRNLARQEKLCYIRTGGRVIVTKEPWLLEYPEHIKAEVRSANINPMERLCWRMNRHPRIMWRSYEYLQAAEHIAAVTGIDVHALAKARTLSQAVTVLAAALSVEYPQEVAAVIREAYEKKQRIWRRVDFARKILAVRNEIMSQQIGVGSNAQEMHGLRTSTCWGNK